MMRITWSPKIALLDETYDQIWPKKIDPQSIVAGRGDEILGRIKANVCWSWVICPWYCSVWIRKCQKYLVNDPCLVWGRPSHDVGLHMFGALVGPKCHPNERHVQIPSFTDSTMIRVQHSTTHHSLLALSSIASEVSERNRLPSKKKTNKTCNSTNAYIIAYNCHSQLFFEVTLQPKRRHHPNKMVRLVRMLSILKSSN